MTRKDPARAAVPQATTAGVAADNAAISARRRRALVTTALRTKSVYAREILAQAAWPGHTPAELEAWFCPPAAHGGPGDDAGRIPGLPARSRAKELADYARVLAVQLSGDDDRERRCAWTMLESVARRHWSELTRAHVELLAQLRVRFGRPADALDAVKDSRVRAGVRTSVQADALHPQLSPDADPARWVAAFNAALHSERLAPYLPPAPGELPGLDRLRVESRPEVPAPLKVTVMMSAYRPGPALLTAVSSVLAQTWPNLELLVVDDASGPGPDRQWAALLDQAEAMDERVRVIRKAINGGTYRARNTALRQATGDLAIVMDSDDWWHPQTLEVCARPLLGSPRLMAVRAQGVRVPPELVLTRPGYVPRFESAATVLYRLRPVVSRIGFYDPTRKGADTEYTRRLVATFGDVVHDVRETTTLLRSGEDTLSAQEFSNGWRHPVRHQYKALYTPWHEQISLAGVDPYLDPEAPRRFPEPLRWSAPTHPLLAEQRHLDLCLAGDWRRHGGPQRSMVEEIRAAREAGLRVGIMHLEALRFMTPTDATLSEPVLDLIRRGEVTWVQADDDVDIDVLMIRYPPILQYPPRLTRRVRARHVLVMANQGPIEADGTDQRYVVRDVSARAEELFGRPVQWVPQSPTIRALLLEQDPEVALTSWDNPGLIDLEAWTVRPVADGPDGAGRPIVIGRHSRDANIKFPQSYDELLTGYAFGEGYEVRMLGATGAVDRLQQAADRSGEPVPANWTLLPHESQDVRDFLSGLDFYLYLDNPLAHEAFGRTLLEAASSGVLTIAHPKHRSTFGDAIDYAEPGQAQELIARYVADPSAYRARVEATREAVARRYGHAGFVDHLRPLLEAGSPVPAAHASTRGTSTGEVLLTLAGDPDLAPVPATTRHTDPAEARGSELMLRTLGTLPTSSARVEVLPLRSAADAEHADAAVVVHDDVPTATLRPWLRQHLSDTASPTWSPQDLLSSAPPGVRAVLVARDGLVLAAGRGRWDGPAPDEELIALVGGPVPEGWAQHAWSRTRAPRTLALHDDAQRPPSPRPRSTDDDTAQATGRPDTAARSS